MTTRAEQKQQSRDKILEAAGRRLRVEGMNGAGVAAVMADAGLTHGAFYSHFSNKDELAREALIHALRDNRERWTGKPQRESWGERLKRLAKRYLTPAHRRDLKESCALAALGSEAARSNDEFKQTYEQELLKTLSIICEGEFDQADAAQAEEALAFMSLIIGSITLSRAVQSKELSDQLLQAGRNAAEKLATDNARKEA